MCYLLIILPEAICCCLETFNVYVVVLMLFCIIVNKLMATTANIRYLQVYTFINLSPKAIYLLLFTNMLYLWCVGDIAIQIHTNFISANIR